MPHVKSPKTGRVKGYQRGTPAKGARVPVLPSTPRSLTPRVQAAIKAMVWDGLKMTDAAKAVSLTPSALSQALMKAAVKEALKREIEVFRTGARASNFSIALDIRDDKEQPGKTRLEAARYLDGDSGKPGVQVNIGLNVTPGYTVVTGSGGSERARQLLQLSGSSRNVLDYQDDGGARSDSEDDEASEHEAEGEDDDA